MVVMEVMEVVEVMEVEAAATVREGKCHSGVQTPLRN
jgi:hypothetical protein